MKPMGRQYYRNKTGSKHHVRIHGKFYAWWTDVCTPSKKRERQQVKRDISNETLRQDRACNSDKANNK